jgi:hypothetical protein
VLPITAKLKTEAFTVVVAGGAVAVHVPGSHLLDVVQRNRSRQRSHSLSNSCKYNTNIHGSFTH